MIDIDIDMRQYDCPFIDTTDDVDIAFSAVQWQLDANANELETRLIAESDSRGELEAGLMELREHPHMNAFDIFSKTEGVAHIRTIIEQTNAMETIQQKGGYITGPFHIEDGTERWHVGFDDDEIADDTLSSLDRKNDFTVEERESFSISRLFDILENSDSAKQLLDGCRSLTETERTTLVTAADEGYFEAPRETSLSTLSDHFGVSKTAVSMNLRRGERKILGAAVDAITELERTERANR